MTYRLRDSTEIVEINGVPKKYGGRVSPPLRNNVNCLIKCKLYVLFRVEGKRDGKTQQSDILSNSDFMILKDNVDYREAFNRALFNAYWIAVKRGYASDVRIIKFKGKGFAFADGVKVKRVKRRGRYYNYFYVRGRLTTTERWTSRENETLRTEIEDITVMSEIDQQIQREM